MARKPGVHTTKIYAFKSRVLGKYINARAWHYDGPQDYKIRQLSTLDHPVSVAKTEKTAKKLRDLIPDCLGRMINDADLHIDRARQDLDRVLSINRTSPPNGGYNVEYYQESLDHRIQDREELVALMNHPIDIMLVEIRTETQETVV